MSGETVDYKLGRLAPHDPATHPRLRLGDFLRAEALPPTPAVVDWVSKVSAWPMYGNDSWGCCVWAMIGHAIEAFTTYGTGATVTVADADVLKGYSDVTGFDPNAGPPGNNPTDQGTVIQDALGYWRKTGVGGHKILAFAEVDVRNQLQVDAAAALFGHLMIGIDFPASAMQQFHHGQPWDAVPNDGGSDGGHAVDVGYDAGARALRVVTWAKVQEMTPAFWSRYVGECWVVVSPEWLDATGRSPEGLDVAAMNEAFTELTGQPGPFPVSPAPAPQPSPAPAPAPVVDAADRALAAAVTPWAAKPHNAAGANVAKAFTAWKAAKGL